MPKGEKVLAQSKRTTPPPISKMCKCSLSIGIKEVFQLVSYFWYNFKLVWPLSKLISKTLLNTKRRISLRGVCLVKGKVFETGEKISNLENASRNLTHIPLTTCKKTLKKNFQNICKNKTCGASVVQKVKMKKAIHVYLMKCKLV
jgi:hypothetical protein